MGILYIGNRREGRKMKKIMKSMLAALMSLSLVACGSKKPTGGTQTPKPTTAPTPTPAAQNVLEAESSDDTVFGTIEDVFRTVFFDFRVNDVTAMDSYGDILAEDDQQILVVDLTVTNNDSSEVEMYDTDFSMLFIDADGNAVDSAYPVTAEGYEKSGDMLDETYVVKGNSSVTGEIVFVVPTDYTDFALCYMEEFASGETGATFFVQFYFE